MFSKRKRVEFSLSAPDAEKVFLTGTFNNWSASSDSMKKDGTGTWKKRKQLAEGGYEYKFIVDEEWQPDPECAEEVRNSYGTANSVINV